jgi:hypothetical protein
MPMAGTAMVERGGQPPALDPADLQADRSKPPHTEPWLNAHPAQPTLSKQEVSDLLRHMQQADGLRSQLRELRATAQDDLQRGIWQHTLAGTLLLLVLLPGWLGSMGSLLEMLGWWMQGGLGNVMANPDYGTLWPAAFLCLLTPGLIAYIAYLVWSAKRFAEWTYVQTARGLKHADYGLLFADEAIALELRSVQDRNWVQTLLPEQLPSTLGERLELAAENFPAALLLPGAEEKVQAQLLSRRARRQRRFLFQPPPWLWLTLLVPPVGIPLAVVAVSTYTFLGHHWIASRARLLAFCEYCLDECRLSDGLNTRPPEEPQHWRDKLAAPWRTNCAHYIWLDGLVPRRIPQ